MKKLIILLGFLQLQLIGYGQTDTIVIAKVQHFEKSIPTGWNMYMVDTGDSLVWYPEIAYDTVNLLRDAIVLDIRSKLDRELSKQLAFSYNKEKSMHIDTGNGFLSLTFREVVCKHELVSPFNHASFIQNIVSVKEISPTIPQLQRILSDFELRKIPL